MSDDLEKELGSLKTISAALEALSPDAQMRVLQWVGSKFGFAIGGNHAQQVGGGWTFGQQQRGEREYASLADLFDAAGPSTDKDKALVVAFWECRDDAATFDAQSVNTQLKHLGHGIGNITRALSGLGDDKPALVLQLRKSGTTQQARKLFKITEAGKKRVVDMINKGGGDAAS